jgi:hypothetical protein
VFDHCSSLTRIDGIIFAHSVRFRDCRALKSVVGLGAGVKTADFTGCLALERVRGLPETCLDANFSDCTMLHDVSGLPPSLHMVTFDRCPRLCSLTHAVVDSVTSDLTGGGANQEAVPHGGLTHLKNLTLITFSNCHALTSMVGVPSSTHVAFINCTRLADACEVPEGVQFLTLYGCARLRSVTAFAHSTARISCKHCPSLVRRPAYEHITYDEASTCPGVVVAGLYAAGVVPHILDRAQGRDVAYRIFQYATPGFRTPQSMWDLRQVKKWLYEYAVKAADDANRVAERYRIEAVLADQAVSRAAAAYVLCTSHSEGL